MKNAVAVCACLLLVLTLCCAQVPASPPGWAHHGLYSQAPELPRLMPGDDALDEVNAWRAGRGLRPFLPDPALNLGARLCARQRAALLCEGHLPGPLSDYGCMPQGCPPPTATGLAAWEASLGWGSCCTNGNYLHAGAAWALGRDGRRYMSLFVR